MKTSDLHREWARVLDMCEGTSVNPFFCWKYNGENRWFNPIHNGEFDGDPNKHEFMVAILEDKPVFVGDTVYHRNGQRCTIVNMGAGFCINDEFYSWNPPKKTFMINGEELPIPNRIASGSVLKISANDIEHHFFYFNGDDDARKCLYVLSNILNKESTGNGE